MRVQRPVILAVCLVALLACGPAPASTLTEGSTDLDLDPLRTLLQGFVDDGELPGASLLLAQHGDIVFEEAYGWADINSEKPFTTDTMAAIWSDTKSLSASCVMILVDDGKISLDDPVSKYIPAYGERTIRGTGVKASSPTIRQLLEHTSGIVSDLEEPKYADIVLNMDLTLAEVVDLIAQEELVAEPGTRYSYGEADFQAAGRIVELVSGQPFDVFMQERLLTPLGMTDTTFRPSPAQALRIAQTYAPGSSGFRTFWPYDPETEINLIMVAGGLYSTLRDLAAYLQMHLNGGAYGSTRILSSAAVAEMQKDGTGDVAVGYSPDQLEREHRGPGWRIDRAGPDGQALSISHGGIMGTLTWIDLDRDLVGVFFTNGFPTGRALREVVHEKVLEIFPASD